MGLLKEGGSVTVGVKSRKYLLSDSERRFIESSPLLTSAATYDNTVAQSQNGGVAGGDVARNVTLAGFIVPATRKYYVPSIVFTSTIEGDFNLQIGNGSLQAIGNTSQRTLNVKFGPGGGSVTVPFDGYLPERCGIFMVTNTAIVGSGVRAVSIANAGSGYVNGTHQLVFTGGGGSGARGTVTVSGGVMTTINMVSPGTGYTSAPTITFPTATGGSNASLTALVGGIGFFKVSMSTPGADNLTNDNIIGADKIIGGFGDSIFTASGPTYGNQFTPFLIRDWYKSNGVNAGIIVKGNGGYNFANIIEMLNTQMGYMGYIDLLVLNIGMNDAVEYGSTPATFQSNMAKFMEWRNIFYKDVPTILCGPTPRQDANETALIAMRTWISGYVNGLDSSVRFCNLSAGFDRTINGNYTDGTGANGVHPSAAGHAIMANNLKNTLQVSPAITLA